jgi:hypothetical protein
MRFCTNKKFKMLLCWIGGEQQKKKNKTKHWSVVPGSSQESSQDHRARPGLSAQVSVVSGEAEADVAYPQQFALDLLQIK